MLVLTVIDVAIDETDELLNKLLVLALPEVPVEEISELLDKLFAKPNIADPTE